MAKRIIKDKIFAMKISRDRFRKLQDVAQKRETTVAGLINQLLNDYVLGVGLDGRPIQRADSVAEKTPKDVSGGAC